jgi:hypothetical protein
MKYCYILYCIFIEYTHVSLVIQYGRTCACGDLPGVQSQVQVAPSVYYNCMALPITFNKFNQK